MEGVEGLPDVDGAVNVLRVDAKACLGYYCGMSLLDWVLTVFLCYVIFGL